MATLIGVLREDASEIAPDDKRAGVISANGPYREALASLDSAIRESRAEIECADLPDVRADSMALFLVFRNLLENAIKEHAGKSTPKIHTSAVFSERYWRFTIAGQEEQRGITSRQSAFEAGRRGPVNAGSENDFGLFICRRLLKAQGGAIWAESSPGNARRFHFTLPPATGEAADSAAAVGESG